MGAANQPTRIQMNRLTKSFALTLASLGIMAGNASALITVDAVNVGNLGNANDATGFGAVGYSYAIGTTEVTLSQYAAFLNSVAKTDTYGLYNANIGADPNVRGISRSGSSGSFTYTVIGTGTRPVSYVSWFDAARFANWMQNGQPVGLQAAGTTETGAYTLNGALTGNTFTRNPGATYALPSESEWYKAAYYQPAAEGGDADNYWLYPTKNNSVPHSLNGSASDPNSANFLFDDGIANGFNGGYAVTQSPTYSASQNYLTAVGAFSLAGSFYGTFDQGGNVREWTEAASGPNNRVVRGGAWNGGDANLSALNRNALLPLSEVESIGFRITVIPEPGAGGIMALGMAMWVWTWKRKRTL
jgi:formylglycine-generating enzyme required for sulfatase activity